MTDRVARVPSPSVTVETLHRVSPVEALALVDERLGPPEEWPSPLIAYRLSSEFQKDWKVELGQWLAAAREFGFLDAVEHQIRTQAKRPSKKSSGKIDPNDHRHLKLHQHLATPRVIHFLTATGWSFVAYEPESGGPVDIDCSLLAPGGQPIEFQVKAPDQPGEVANHMLVDGEFDGRVQRQVEHAATQLRRPARTAAIIAVCANRNWSLAWDPSCLVSDLIGLTTQIGEQVCIREGNRGRFFGEAWDHVSGVLLLDLSRGGAESRYISTVLTNPAASYPIDPSWFPRSRVCVLEGQRFRWVRGAPSEVTGLPDGTRLMLSPV